MKIDVLCSDGSPLGVSEASIYGEDGRIGVGGAELALLTLLRLWHDAGHTVRLYNNPTPNSSSVFQQLNTIMFVPDEQRDILIIFRSPNLRATRARGKKIWFSTDQYTVGDFASFANSVDKIVTISPTHADYFRNRYGIDNTTTIDLPVRVWDYEKKVEKRPYSLLFCSVPDRGLHILADCYDEIQARVPEVNLTITSDYRLWGVPYTGNSEYVQRFLGKRGVVFLGAVNRNELVNAQLESQILAYPCKYEELFCYSVAESSVAGCLPITSDCGAIKTTNMGVVLEGDALSHSWKSRFIDTVVDSLVRLNTPDSTELPESVLELQAKAKHRFSPSSILCKWDEVFYG